MPLSGSSESSLVLASVGVLGVNGRCAGGRLANPGRFDCLVKTQRWESRSVLTHRDFCPVQFRLLGRKVFKPMSTAALFPEGFKVAITCHLNGDPHERSNETVTVPTCHLVKPQSRERARVFLRGKKTLLSSAVASSSGAIYMAELVGSGLPRR